MSLGDASLARGQSQDRRPGRGGRIGDTAFTETIVGCMRSHCHQRSRFNDAAIRKLVVRGLRADERNVHP